MGVRAEAAGLAWSRAWQEGAAEHRARSSAGAENRLWERGAQTQGPVGAVAAARWQSGRLLSPGRSAGMMPAHTSHWRTRPRLCPHPRAGQGASGKRKCTPGATGSKHLGVAPSLKPAEAPGPPPRPSGRETPHLRRRPAPTWMMSDSFCKPAVLLNSPVPVGAADAGRPHPTRGGSDPPPPGSHEQAQPQPSVAVGRAPGEQLPRCPQNTSGVSGRRKEALCSGTAGPACPPPGPGSPGTAVTQENETHPVEVGPQGHLGVQTGCGGSAPRLTDPPGPSALFL